MADPYERYVREIHDSLRYWATWTPGEHIRLGDCGPVKDWVFQPQANVEDFGIEFEVLEGRAETPISHTSDKAIEVTLQSTAEADRIPGIPQGSAGIKIGFAREHAIVFALVGGRADRIKNIFELKRQVIGKAQSNEFPEDFVVVTNLMVARSATVLISEASHGSFVASADADFKAGVVDVANASLGVAQRSASHVRTELLARGDVTPLFNAFKLKTNVWHDFDVDTLSDDALDEGSLPFVELAPDAYAAGE